MSNTTEIGEDVQKYNPSCFDKVLVKYNGVRHVGVVLDVGGSWSVYIPCISKLHVVNLSFVTVEEVLGVAPLVSTSVIKDRIVRLVRETDLKKIRLAEVVSAFDSTMEDFGYTSFDGYYLSTKVENPVQWTPSGQITTSSGKVFSLFWDESKTKLKLIDEYKEILIIDPSDLSDIVKYN
jgi:hypothetical protein